MSAYPDFVPDLGLQSDLEVDHVRRTLCVKGFPERLKLMLRAARANIHNERTR